MKQKETTRLNCEVPTVLYANLAAYCSLHKTSIKDEITSYLKSLPMLIIQEVQKN